MGWGDELMVTGQARELQQRDPSMRVMVLDRKGARREHEAWQNNPRIAAASDSGPFHVLRNGPGHRPYISQKAHHQWVWRPFKCPVGEIYLTDAERAFAARFDPGIIIEPHIKERASPNKNWGYDNWIKLSKLLFEKGMKLSQMGPAGTKVIDGVQHIETPTMRHACAVLARAQVAILPEGGLHHAAAALGIKAVVIFGGFIAPSVTGYSMHANMYIEDRSWPNGCGFRMRCVHCKHSMNRITPERVVLRLEEILK